MSLNTGKYDHFVLTYFLIVRRDKYNFKYFDLMHENHMYRFISRGAHFIYFNWIFFYKHTPYHNRNQCCILGHRVDDQLKRPVLREYQVAIIDETWRYLE